MCSEGRLKPRVREPLPRSHGSGQGWKEFPHLECRARGEMSHLHFLMFEAQGAGAHPGQVHPECTEEQQAADGPQGRHGLSWLGIHGPGGETPDHVPPLPSPPSIPSAPPSIPVPQPCNQPQGSDLDLGPRLLSRQLSLLCLPPQLGAVEGRGCSLPRMFIQRRNV